MLVPINSALLTFYRCRMDTFQVQSFRVLVKDRGLAPLEAFPFVPFCSPVFFVPRLLYTPDVQWTGNPIQETPLQLTETRSAAGAEYYCSFSCRKDPRGQNDP